METKRTSHLVHYGNSGWLWSVTVNDLLLERSYIRHYRTNSDGKGLWVIRSYVDQQIEGTAEFSLSQDRDKALRQIRKYNKTANLY